MYSKIDIPLAGFALSSSGNKNTNRVNTKSLKILKANIKWGDQFNEHMQHLNS